MNKTCRCLVRFEKRAATIYKTFARLFARRGDLAWFWLEMSMEDNEHAVLLEFCGCEDLLAENTPDGREIRALSNLFRALSREPTGKTCPLTTRS